MTRKKYLRSTNVNSRSHKKANGPQPHSTNSSTSSVVGVYSSSSDPVHVPAARPAASVGAIRREVGVVGPRRQSLDNSAKPSSQNISLPNTQSGRESHSRDSARPVSALPKGDQSVQDVAPESAMPGLPANRSFSSNQYGSRQHQLMGHQKAPQPNQA
ncbi:hypothetical protein ACP275_13G070300 [Erythranthe tilingii]